TTTGARSRGTCTARGSAAIAAWAVAILAASELTHCRPELSAIRVRSASGNSNLPTVGIVVAGGATAGAAAGAATNDGATDGAAVAAIAAAFIGGCSPAGSTAAGS